METKWNKLLARQISRNLGPIEKLPVEIRTVFKEINNAYINFEEDIDLLQNSLEISSQEQRDAFLKQKQNADAHAVTINKIKEAIFALTPDGNAVVDDSGNNVSDSSYLFDSLINLIADRNRVEQQLKESENLQRSLLENVAVGIVIIDQETRTIDSVNTFASILMGEDSKKIIGRKCHQYMCPTQEKSCPVCDRGLEVDNSERVLLRADKTPLAVLKTVKRIQIAGRWKLLESFVDISVQKNAELALQQSSKKWEAIVSASPDGIGMASLDGKLQLMSEKLALMYGYTVEQKDEYISKTIFDFIDPSNHTLLKENIGRLLSGQGGRKITEYIAIKKDNSRFYVDVNSTVLYDASGKPESILFIERDISERKQAEEEKTRQSGLIASLLDSIPDIIFFKDVNGVYLGGNPAFAEFCNLKRDEIVGITDYDLFDNEIAAAFREQDVQMMESRKPSHNDVWITYTDGRKALVDTLKTPYLGPDGEVIGVLGISRDITERKQAEEALKQITTRLELATRAGGVGVWDFDVVNNQLLWDNQMFALYGVDEKDFDGAYEHWQAGLHFDDKAQGDAEIQMALRGEKEFDTEFRVVWPDGSVRNIRALAFVLRDEAGKPLRMIGTNWDITQQKNTETALIKAKYDADVANKSKSEFLANMSHEIRTPLNGIIGFTDLLIKTPLTKIQKQYTENVNTSGHSLLSIINDILDFSKIEAGKMELDFIKTDIIELTEHASDIIKYHASQKGLELLLNIQPNMPRFAFADPTRLKQILVNLLSNAVKFTQAGEVELKVTFFELDETKGRFKFSIRDTGIGLNIEQQLKLFKAFTQADSSTTRKFGGTGLGLAISNMLAEKMGSKIEILSETDSGSTFFFTLETEYEVGEKLHYGSLTDINRILVIDDNDNNRLILEHTFISWGIEFVGVDNGLSALKIIERSKAFDAIIVDYHMPYLNGIDTIRMIREQLVLPPEKQPVILLHSSSDDLALYDECKKLGVRFNLTKPVKSHELLHYLKSIHTYPDHEHVESEVAVHGFSDLYTNNSAPVILVAEDNVLNMLLITTIIKQMLPNVMVIEAVNGKLAIEKAIENNPTLIFMDIQMPVMGGLEATERIRAYEHGKGSNIPIVGLTAGAVKGEKEKCISAGMDDFLTKPIDHKALVEILKKYLAETQSKT